MGLSSLREGEQTLPESSDSVGKPRDPEIAQSVAYLRLIGMTQEDAAAAAGCSERSIRYWESASWWPEIVRAAEDRWLSGLVSRARKALLDGMNPDNAALALKVLERRIPELAPAPTDHNHYTPQGIQVEHLSDDELEKRAGQLANRVAMLGASASGANGSHANGDSGE